MLDAILLRADEQREEEREDLSLKIANRLGELLSKLKFR